MVGGPERDRALWSKEVQWDHLTPAQTLLSQLLIKEGERSQDAISEKQNLLLTITGHQLIDLGQEAIASLPEGLLLGT